MSGLKSFSNNDLNFVAEKPWHDSHDPASHATKLINKPVWEDVEPESVSLKSTSPFWVWTNVKNKSAHSCKNVTANTPGKVRYSALRCNHIAEEASCKLAYMTSPLQMSAPPAVLEEYMFRLNYPRTCALST